MSQAIGDKVKVIQEKLQQLLKDKNLLQKENQSLKIKQDDPGEYFGQSVYEIINQRVKEYNYPVCFDFPVGHQIDNFALKCGVMHELYVRQSGSELNEK